MIISDNDDYLNRSTILNNSSIIRHGGSNDQRATSTHSARKQQTTSPLNEPSQFYMNDDIINFLQGEISLLWIIFGTIGNLLSLFVLLRHKMRMHSTFTYLTLLSVCDTFVLYFGLLRDYLVNKYKIDISSDILCKFHVFSFYFVLHLASWLLVAVNIDRLIAASFLSLSRKWCTPQTALKVSCFLTVVLMLLNSHFIYFVNSTGHSTVNTHPNQTTKLIVSFVNSSYFLTSADNLNQTIRLSSTPYGQQSNQELFSHFSTFLSPKLTVEEGNESFYELEKQEPINPYVYKKCLIKANNRAYSFFFQKIYTWIDASAQVILPFAIMVICNVNIIHKVLLAKNKTNGKNVKRLRRIKGMCIMIVSVSIIFFILEAPVLIFICLMQADFIQPDWPHIRFFWTVMNLMMYTNHVINFLSYCMTGTKFRRELLRLLYMHKIIKYVSSYKSINMLTSTHHANHTNMPMKSYVFTTSNNNRDTLTNRVNMINNLKKIEIMPATTLGLPTTVVNEINNVRIKTGHAQSNVQQKMVNFELKEPSACDKNLIINNATTENIDKILVKPISLTNRIISKKMQLGESAILSSSSYRRSLNKSFSSASIKKKLSKKKKTSKPSQTNDNFMDLLNDNPNPNDDEKHFHDGDSDSSLSSTSSTSSSSSSSGSNSFYRKSKSRNESMEMKFKTDNNTTNTCNIKNSISKESSYDNSRKVSAASRHTNTQQSKDDSDMGAVKAATPVNETIGKSKNMFRSLRFKDSFRKTRGSKKLKNREVTVLISNTEPANNTNANNNNDNVNSPLSKNFDDLDIEIEEETIYHC